MKTFVRIVDTGRLGAAAKSRGMSVAAVSRQLSALERELGATLVVRSTRQLVITDRGRHWYQYCVSALAGLAAARADLAEGAEARGTVVISAPISFAITLLVPIIERVSRENPRLSVELRLQDQAIDLLADGVDIAVRVGMPLPDSVSVVGHRLITFRRTLLASAAYLRREGTPKHPAQLASHRLLVHTQASPSFTRWQFTRRDESVEVRPEGRLQSTSPVVLREWAERGAGITLIPSWFSGDLKPVLSDWLTPEITASAIHRAESRSAPRVRVVLDALTVGIPAAVASAAG